MSTTNEQRLREALTELLAHCGERGWWMKSPAIAVIDKAHAALSEPAAPVDAWDALERIVGMCGDTDRCACGRPTGIPAIVSCARTALARQATDEQIMAEVVDIADGLGTTMWVKTAAGVNLPAGSILLAQQAPTTAIGATVAPGDERGANGKSTTDEQRLRNLLKEIREPIRLAAQSCRARAFDQMNNSNSQKFWQQNSDNLDAAIDKIDAAKAISEPAAPVDARADPIQELISKHAELLADGPYAHYYFELAYTRQTQWMAWLCSKPREDDPSRIVIAKGQGDTAEAACADALAAGEKS